MMIGVIYKDSYKIFFFGIAVKMVE